MIRTDPVAMVMTSTLGVWPLGTSDDTVPSVNDVEGMGSTTDS